MEVDFSFLCAAAAELTEIPLKTCAAGEEETLYPEKRELFAPRQMPEREAFARLVRNVRPGQALVLQDRAAALWFILALKGRVILGGPYLREMITREETLQLYEALKGKEKSGRYYYEREDEEQRRFRLYLMRLPLSPDGLVMKLMAFLARLTGEEPPAGAEQFSLLQVDYTRYRAEDYNRYLSYQEDCEAGLTACVAHAIESKIPLALDTVYSFPVDGEGERDAELVRFALIVQLIRNGARRASVPAAATRRTMRKCLAGLGEAREKEQFHRLAEDFAIEMCHLVKTCSNHLYSPLICSVMDRIRSGFTQAMTLKSISGEFGVNESWLAAAFKKETGKTVGALILEMRLEYARTMLTVSTLDVGEIGQEAGFTDHSYFTKQFRRAYGQTPSAYREMLSHSRRG